MDSSERKIFCNVKYIYKAQTTYVNVVLSLKFKSDWLYVNAQLLKAMEQTEIYRFI